MTRPIRPLKYPRWASEIKQHDNSNIKEPLSIEKDSGWREKEPPARQYFNWLANTTYRWIAYLDQKGNFCEEFEKSKLPKAQDNKGRIVLVSDVEGRILSFSDGINWKKIKTEGNI